MKKFEYTVKIYSMDELKKGGVDIEEENSIVYACRPGGECEVHNVGVEQLDNLSGLLNEMGASGWELVELVFHQSGIVSFWKRLVAAPQGA
ncbi:MAG: hypothetical protein PHC90_08260 [Syntrophorhabdaceae bacterium]|nr:hypothetical protein [Syntrophorhabdaceae bacterium]